MSRAKEIANLLVAEACTAHAAFDLRMFATARSAAQSAAALAEQLADVIPADAPDWTSDDVDELLDFAGLRVDWRDGGECV